MIGEHVLAGYVNDAGGREALGLADAIAGLTGGRLSVATVHPPGLPAAAGEARALLDQAADLLDDRPADLHVQEGRGVGRGLGVLASRIGADVIVVGSPEGGARGRIGVGAAADHLLHSATEAVMLAPSGYTPPDEFTRITVMYVRRPQCDDAVIRAAQAADRLDVPLRLVTLAVGDIGDGETERLRDDLALALRLAAESADLTPEDVSAELAEGDDVAAALHDTDWPTGELLVCASSEDAAAHRVFLGEVALKVLRAAPCPVAVLPRGYF
ncbi:universal stress protein [Actinomadura meridiana]|uniref:Universal stress protein n=1 Tax=Actinomadura meridiana TaxID=559626 RepID=A0ABP8BW63_9ACTN